jgi:rubrerythrin
MAVEKKKLLKMLEEAVTLEDHAIPIYTRHLKTALFWSGLPAHEREQLRIQLGILLKESERHSKLLGEMRRKIQEDPRDVF